MGADRVGDDALDFCRRYYEEDATLAPIAEAKGVSVKTVQRIQMKRKRVIQAAFADQDEDHAQ